MSDMADLMLRNDQLGGWGSGVPCMRCGAPATCVVEKTFTLRRMPGERRPSFIRLLDLLSVTVRPKRRRVPVPLCDKHRNHWRRYRLVVTGCSLMSLLLLGFLASWLTVKTGSLLDPRNADAV